MSHPKKGIRWRVFKLFGPPELKHLVQHLDELTSDGSDIAIYQCGEFPFNVKTSNGDDLEPMIFPTPQERAAFQLGLSYGVGLMGGSTAALSQDEFEELDKMEKKSTHGGGGHRNN